MRLHRASELVRPSCSTHNIEMVEIVVPVQVVIVMLIVMMPSSSNGVDGGSI